MKPNTSLAPTRSARAHGRERQRAVAGDDGGHAVLRHRVDQRVPPHRRVVVRVAVDEPGRDERAAGVDDRLAVGREPGADLGDRRRRGCARRRRAAVRPSRRRPCRPGPAGSPVMALPCRGGTLIRLAASDDARRRAADDPRSRARARANVGASTSSRSRSMASICQTVSGVTRLDAGAVGTTAEHVGVAEDVAGGDLASPPGPAASTAPVPPVTQERGRGHRPLVVQAVARLQLAGPGHRPHPIVVGHREALEHVHRHRPHPSPPTPPAPTVGSQTRTLYIVCIALYILSVLAFFRDHGRRRSRHPRPHPRRHHPAVASAGLYGHRDQTDCGRGQRPARVRVPLLPGRQGADRRSRPSPVRGSASGPTIAPGRRRPRPPGCDQRSTS